MKFRVLGTIEVRDGDRAVDIGGGRSKTVLACLLLHAGQTVSRARLVEMAWARIPDSAESNLRTYLSRLRKSLTPSGERQSRLISDSAGHRLVTRDGELDLEVFASLESEADRLIEAGDHAAAADRCEQAVALWQGAVFDGAIVESRLSAARAELTERRDQLHLKGLRARLQAGGHAAVLGSLRALVVSDPTHQELVGLLMLALYRGGRQDEALALFRDTRRRLIDELGVEPGAELTGLQRQVLAGSQNLKAPDVSRARRAGDVVPAQLPANVPGFTGRAAESRAVCERARDRAADPGAATGVIVDGMGGVGKTALAVHTAHRLSGDFTDGQLFLDLHGYTDGVAPVDPADALQRMLRALGVPEGDVPAGLDDRAGLYRSVLASRKVLVVLDNCADATQLSPLLPGDGKSFVIATSRRRLLELDSAVTQSLDVLDTRRSAELFRVASGAGDTGEPDADALVAEIVGRCGRLPLAIRLAAGRLRGRSGWSLRRLRDRLGEADRLLEELALGERNVAAALSLSYRDLPEEVVRGFELLAAHPGAEFDRYAAAALTDHPLRDAEDLLEHLADANLVAETTAPGRYRMHDLVRAHALRSLRGRDEPHARRSGLKRLLGYYSAAASRARGQLVHELSDDREVPDSAFAVPDVDGVGQARRWFELEFQALSDAVAAAVANEFDSHAVDISVYSWTYGHRYGRYLEVIRMLELAAPAVERLRDNAIRAHMMLLHGTASQFAGRAGEALPELVAAAEAFRDCGDRVGELKALSNLIMPVQKLGQYSRAITTADRAVALAELLGESFVKCVAIINVSASYRFLARHEAGAGLLDEVLTIAAAIEVPLLRANALVNLGHIRQDLGDFDTARDCHAEAEVYFASRDEPNSLAEALFGQMRALRCLGDTAAARGFADRVLHLVEDSSNPEVKANAYLEVGLCELAAGSARLALAHIERARAAAEELALQELHSRLETALAEVARTMGDIEQAAIHDEQAARQVRELGIVRPDELDGSPPPKLG